MLVTYLRSSSIGGYEWCEHSHWIGSNLGRSRAPGTAASVGSSVHKALELLAKQKQAWVNGEASIHEPEMGLTFPANTSPLDFLKPALDYYSEGAQWDDEAYERAQAWLTFTIEYDNGKYDPRKLDVVVPEQYFDLEIREPWAYYDYRLPDGTKLSGYLRIKGTVDLLTRVQPGLLHYIDWKTGKRNNWTTMQVKETPDLRKDPQFLMYYYALRRLYPDDDIFFTVFFTREGPFTLCFDDSHIQKSLDTLRFYFDKIRLNTSPRLAQDNARQRWKCSRCSYSEDRMEGSDQTICEFFRNQRVQLGMEKVFARYGDVAGVSRYGSGGGRSG